MSVGPLIGKGTTTLTGLAGNGSAAALLESIVSAPSPKSRYRNKIIKYQIVIFNLLPGSPTTRAHNDVGSALVLGPYGRREPADGIVANMHPDTTEERAAPLPVKSAMKVATTMWVIGLSTFACIAAGAEPAKPVVPDYDYCARRDADPEKCVIQDGPPHRHLVRTRQVRR